MCLRRLQTMILFSLHVMSVAWAGSVQAGASPVLVAVVVGNNRYVGDVSQNLSHADDDALRLAETLRSRLPESRIRLLVKPDDETIGKFRLEEAALNGLPLAAPIAEPTWAELVSAMDGMQTEVEQLLKERRRAVALFFFAGHHTTGGKLHLQDQTLPGSELETLMHWANNRGGVLRLDWRDACTSAASLSVHPIGTNTQIVGTEEQVTEYENLKGSILTSLLVTGLSGAAAGVGENYVSVRGLARWLGAQLSPYLKVRIEGPKTRRAPSGEEPWVPLSGPGVEVPPSFPPGAVQIWRQRDTDAPRLEHTWWHHAAVRERIELEPGTYRLVSLISEEEFGRELWGLSWSGAKQVMFNATGLTPVRHFSVVVAESAAVTEPRRAQPWVQPKGPGSLALLSLPSRGDSLPLREQLARLEKTLPGISRLEVTPVSESHDTLMKSDLFNTKLSPLARAGLSESFTLNLYGNPIWDGHPADSRFLCQSNAGSERVASAGSSAGENSKPECGLNVGFAREVPLYYYDMFELNLRVGLRYETSQRKETLYKSSSPIYSFYARHGAGIGVGILGKWHLGPILVALEQSLWWQPTTLWGRSELIQPKNTAGVVMRGALESALSIKLRLGPVFQLGPRLSLAIPLGRSAASLFNVDTAFYDAGYSGDQVHGQAGVEFTLNLH